MRACVLHPMRRVSLFVALALAIGCALTPAFFFSLSVRPLRASSINIRASLSNNGGKMPTRIDGFTPGGRRQRRGERAQASTAPAAAQPVTVPHTGQFAQLEVLLQPHGLGLQECGGDGDCWYLSVLHQVRLVEPRYL